MTTPKRNEAVAPVAWVGPRGDLIDDGRFQSRVNGLPDFGDLSGYQPLYPTSALESLREEIECERVRTAGANERAQLLLIAKEYWRVKTDALQGEVSRLREALIGLVKINEEHNAACEKVMGRPLGWKDDYLDAARKALNLEPPTDGL